jgi:putative aldouronate transport system substrate-binding protein
MVDEGLIDPLSFTQDAEQIKSIGNATQGYAWGASTYYPLNYMSLEDPRAQTWELMGPLAGPNGGDPVATYSFAMPSNHWCVTKTCKYPEAAFRLGDLLVSEKYSVMARFGEEGVDWRKPDPGAEGYYDDIKPYLIPILSWGVTQNKHWANGAPQLGTYRIMTGISIKGQLRFIDLWNAEVTSKARPYFHPENSIGAIVYNRSEFERIAEIRANVETYFQECYTRFLLRDMSLEQDWDKYLGELKAMGLDTYVEVARAAYTRMNQ